MNEEKQLSRLSSEFNGLNEQDKTYILGIAKALSFASNDSCNSTKDNKKNQKTKESSGLRKPADAGYQ